jgi:hypothetical protein
MLIVVSPWLIHTKAVWGSYLRSDSEFSVVQDLAATKSHGDSALRYWHSTSPPPRLSTFVREAPGEFARQTVRGGTNVIRRTLGWWSLRSAATGPVLFIAALLWCVDRRRALSPEGVSLALLASATILVISIRGVSFEERYVDTLTIFFTLFAVLGSMRLWRLCATVPRRAVARAVLIAIWAVLIPAAIVRTYEQTYSRDQRLVSYRANAADVNKQFAHGSPVVVGTTPYFYALETGAVSLNFPDDSDEFLLRYMDRYGASYVFLTGEEVDLWRPSWRSPSQLPRGLRLAGHVGDGYVLRKIDE